LYAYFKAGHLDKNPIIRDGDKITAKSLSRKDPKIGISGSVQRSMEIEFSPNDTPGLLVEIAGGFTPDADTSRVFVYRRGEDEPEKIEVPAAQFDSFKVLPYDRIVVPQAREDLQFASAWVFGEVETPGNYPIKSGETTALELLQISGNLTNRALTSGAYLLRSGSIENEIPDKFNIDLMKRTSDQLAQGLDYLELETNLSQNKVYIDLNDKEQLEKVIIYNGDRIYVPRDEKTIFVFGQINNPGYYPYTNPDASVSEYIGRAGGFALSADQDRVFIIKAGSGTWFKPNETTIESGDRIFIDRIPYDELHAKRTYENQKEQIKNTRIQLIMTGISTITGILTTYVAIQNIRN
jgi:protein involved in polysaccharide export with SLBB domain